MTFTSAGRFLTVGSHMMYGAQGSLRGGDSICHTKSVYLTQPVRDIGLGGIVWCDVPRVDDGLKSLGCKDVVLRSRLVICSVFVVAVTTRVVALGDWIG